jgi:hypothetical protein
VKRIGSAITGLPQPGETPSSSTGKPHGETGSALTCDESPVPAPATPAAMEAALTPLTALLSAYRAVPIGQTLGMTMTPAQRAATLSTLRPLESCGDPMQVLRIVQRLLALYPGKTLPDSVAEDWVRVLKDQPLASVWAVYERTIRKPGSFAPSIGDFYSEVKNHADTVRWIRKSVQEH